MKGATAMANIDSFNLAFYDQVTADVAEQADARDSKSRAREGMWVRLPPSAQKEMLTSGPTPVN